MNRSMLIYRLFLVVAMLVFSSGGANAAGRVALVVGNSNYQNAGSLKNPVNDANLIAASLESAGFAVTKILDADYTTLKRAMLNFGRALRNSPEAGLFYYAGHGVQVRGENYLVPVNASIDDEDEIDLEAININSFLRVMNSSSSSINIVVLDACRNNPFARSFRSASGGLAPVDAPKGTYIAYATSPGDVAADGEGDNSPYSAALSEAIRTPGVTIEQAFKQTRKSVLNATGSKQVPWETSSITGDFYFHPQNEVVKVTPVTKVAPPAPPVSSEAASVYEQIKDSDDIDILEVFTKQFPNEIYSEFLRVKIKKLRVASRKPPKKAGLNIARTAENFGLPRQLKGTLKERGRTYAILLNRIVGGYSVSYPAFPCSGVWQGTVTASSLIFRETINKGMNNCILSGHVTLTSKPDKSYFVEWRRYKTAKVQAAGYVFPVK